MGEVFRHEIRVRYAECDPQGCVFNANYLAYFDLAITELWRAAVGPYAAMVEEGADMVVAEAGIRYRRPVVFDELITLEARIVRLGTTSLTTAIAVLSEGEVAAEGELRHVFVNTGTSTVRPIPEFVREALGPYVENAAAGAA